MRRDVMYKMVWVLCSLNNMVWMRSYEIEGLNYKV